MTIEEIIILILAIISGVGWTITLLKINLLILLEKYVRK